MKLTAMMRIDVRFDNEARIMLRDMIGKEFVKYKCDPFEFSPLVYGLVGIYIGNNVYKLDNFIEVQDHFGHQEDVAIMKLHSADDIQIESCFENVQMIDTPVRVKIDKVRLIEENQQLFIQGDQAYDVWLTRGVIFDLDDGREVSFEKTVWFSEMIEVQKGYDLLNTYASTAEFLEEWDGIEGYSAKCTREIVTIK